MKTVTDVNTVNQQFKRPIQKVKGLESKPHWIFWNRQREKIRILQTSRLHWQEAEH